MNKLSLFAAVVATAALAGSASTSAAVVTNESIPISLAVFVPCADDGAGEVVMLEGELHVLITSTVNDNNVSGKTHFQPQGLSGVGLTTGDKYQGVGVTQDHFKGSLQNGQSTFTFVNNFRLIGQGPDNNLQIHENFHITVNANGDVTVVHDNLSVDCN